MVRVPQEQGEGTCGCCCAVVPCDGPAASCASATARTDAGPMEARSELSQFSNNLLELCWLERAPWLRRGGHCCPTGHTPVAECVGLAGQGRVVGRRDPRVVTIASSLRQHALSHTQIKTPRTNTSFAYARRTITHTASSSYSCSILLQSLRTCAREWARMVKARTGDAHTLRQTIKPSPSQLLKLLQYRFEIQTKWDAGTCRYRGKFMYVGYKLIDSRHLAPAQSVTAARWRSGCCGCGTGRRRRQTFTRKTSQDEINCGCDNCN